MKYQISVPKIHCSGCVELIKVSLEEVFGEGKINMNQELKTAEISSEKEIEEFQKLLNQVFEELEESGYFYSDLKII